MSVVATEPAPVIAAPQQATKAPAHVSRLRSIDFLRGVAALSVVLNHAMLYRADPPTSVPWFKALYNVFTYGDLGVPLFFVISGFCIHLKWARQKSLTGDESLSFLAFWRRRMWRLYPPYLVTLCLSMSLMVVAYLRNADLRLVTDYPEPRLHAMGVDFLLHVTMLHGFHPLYDKMGGNPPFWTLAREEYFYLMYFVLLPWRRFAGVAVALASVAVIGLITPYAAGAILGAKWEYSGVVIRSAFVLWVQWCLGMVAAEAYCGLTTLPFWCSRLWATLAWAVLAYFSTYLDFPFLTSLLWGLVFFTLMNFCIRVEKAGSWPRDRLTAWFAGIGVFSYSLYLVHHPVKGIVKQMLGSFASNAGPWSYLACAALMAIAGFYAGKVFFWLIERHFLFGESKPPSRHEGTMTPGSSASVAGRSVYSPAVTEMPGR